jgi:hypothetical protein
VPWGALWCALFVLLAEVTCRLMPASFFLAVDQHDYGENDTGDYTAVGLAIEHLPAPDVAIIGTSRAREAVLSEILAETVSTTLACEPPVVRNYGTAGGRVDVWLTLFDRMISEGKLPRVLVVALDASDFRDEQPNPDRFRYTDLWTLGDEIARNGRPTEAELTWVIGNSNPLRLSDARATLRHRFVARGRWGGDWVLKDNTAYGGTSGWGREYLQSRQGRKRPAPMKAKRERIQRTARGYVLFEDRLARLGELVERARARGVRVVLADIPASPPVREREAVVAAQLRLHAELERLDDGACVSAWTPVGVEEQFGLREFRDPSHMNVRGAAHFTELIAPLVSTALDSPQACER